VNESGVPIPDANKEPKADGALVSPASLGATNWNPPSYSVETGLFYENASQSYSEFYLTLRRRIRKGMAGRTCRSIPGLRCAQSIRQLAM